MNKKTTLNVALFGQMAKQWRESNPTLEGKMRDYANFDFSRKNKLEEIRKNLAEEYHSKFTW